MMYTNHQLRYFHPGLNIGMADLKNVWLLHPVPLQLSVIVYRGSLTYRIPVTGKRISYRTLKKGLVKEIRVVNVPLYPMPF